MGTKSIRHIVEATLATYLSTQTGLTSVAFLTGDSAATQTLPKPVINGIPKNFGVGLLSVAWINKHTGVQGKNTVSATEKNVDVSVTNTLGNIANIATDASVLDLVYANRVRQMKARVKEHLGKTIDEANSK